MPDLPEEVVRRIRRESTESSEYLYNRACHKKLVVRALTAVINVNGPDFYSRHMANGIPAPIIEEALHMSDNCCTWCCVIIINLGTKPKANDV
jgi:hypothetical protein